VNLVVATVYNNPAMGLGAKVVAKDRSSGTSSEPREPLNRGSFTFISWDCKWLLESSMHGLKGWGMRIGAQAFPRGPPAIEMLSRAHSQGFQALEVVLEEPNAPKSLRVEERIELRDRAERLGVALLVHAPFSHIDPAGLSNKLRTAALGELKSALQLSSDICASLLTLHAPDSKRLTSRVLSSYVSTFASLYSLGRDLGVRLAIENTYQSLEEFLKLLSRIPEEGRFVTFDCGHANIYSNPLAFLEGLSKEIVVNVHIHDNNGSKDEHLVLGKGNIRFEEVLRSLSYRGYKGSLILEHIRVADFASSRKALLGIMNRIS